MKYKKSLLIICLITCVLFSISCVVATEINGTTMAGEDEYQMIGETNNNIEFDNSSPEHNLEELDSNQNLHDIDDDIDNDIPDDSASPITPVFKINVPDKVYENHKTTITFISSDNVNGMISLEFNNAEYNTEFEINNGKGSVNIKLPFEKSIHYRFTSYNILVNDVNGNFNINVIKPIIKANNFKVNYPSKTKYKVQILYKNTGLPIGAGETVTFYLYNEDGKKVATKTGKTDKNGYASVYFNVAPSYYNYATYDGFNYPYSYKIKIKFASTTVTKKYTVKGIDLDIKKFTKNKKLSKDYDGLISGFNKKISISFVLKTPNGKYLKGKTIKFKLNGKTYSKKTNKKGEVTFVLKKSLLKKGYGNKFIISYLKDVYKGNFGFHIKKLFNENYGYKYYIDIGGGLLLPAKLY